MSKAHFITPPRYLVGIVPKVTISVSTNWAGNVAFQCSGCAPYQDVHSTWVEPHYAPTPCPTPVANSNWVGLGVYYDTGTLVQDGTAVGQEDAGVGSHQAWYELISGNTDIFVPIPGLYATAGQYFYADTDHVSGGYDFFLENQYTGANYSNFVSFNHFDGSTAEMITEDPEGAVAHGWDLEKFDPFTVVDAEATRDSSTYRGLANFYHYDVVMYDNNDHQMAYAGSANSIGTSWAFNYVNCS